MACIYHLNIPGQDPITFDSEKAFAEHIIKNNLFDVLPASKKEHSMTTKSLAEALRQTKFGEHNFAPSVMIDFQEQLLTEFIRLEEQSQYFYNIGSAVALTKGLSKNFEHIDSVKERLKALGIGEAVLEDKIPFDVRYLLTGDEQYKETHASPYFHNITANNIRIMNEIDMLSRTMFLERTPSFQYTSEKVKANLKDDIFADAINDMQDELSAFIQLAAYKQWLKVNGRMTDTLRNSLIYDNEDNLPTIVDIAHKAIQIAPNNAFLKFILPVSTTVKIGNKLQFAKTATRDLINTIEGKTRGSLEPDLIADMMDSFAELYNNIAARDPMTGEYIPTRYYAKALFDYLVVKDGLMFKNKSFIKLLPTELFSDMSQATEFATKVMAANSLEEFKRVLNELKDLEIIDPKTFTPAPFFSKDEIGNIRNLIKEQNIKALRDVLYLKMFNKNFNSLYHTFEQIYGYDVRNGFDLQLISATVVTNGKRKVADGISYVRENDINYIHVSVFPKGLEKYPKPTEEDSEGEAAKKTQARLEYLNQVEVELTEAGFKGVRDENDKGEKRRYAQFKKFIRVRERVGEEFVTRTYQLVSVSRDSKQYSGVHMTEEGDMIPKGDRAIYAPISPNGTSNSTGVADLSDTRPTAERVKQIVKNKIDRNNKGGQSGSTPLPVAPKPPTQPSAPQRQNPTEDVPATRENIMNIMKFASPADEFGNIPSESPSSNLNTPITVDMKLVAQLKETPAFKDSAAFLSNFAPYQKGEEFVYGGISFPSNEHYYQAMKFRNTEIRKKIAEHGFKGLKAFTRTLGAIREDWDSVKDGVMKLGLEHKFNQPRFKSLLLSTGNEDLIERNTWNDTYWGVANGQGQNNLGKMLMEIRSKLRGNTPIVEQGSLFNTPAAPTQPFNSLGMLDPDDDGSPLSDFTDEDINNQPC